MTTEKLKPLTKKQRKEILQKPCPPIGFPYKQITGVYSINCCGVVEVCGITFCGVSLDGEHLTKLLHQIVLNAHRNCIVMTDIRPRPDLEMLGFKLVRKPFRNSNSGNQIWMYTGLRSEITGGLQS